MDFGLVKAAVLMSGQELGWEVDDLHHNAPPDTRLRRHRRWMDGDHLIQPQYAPTLGPCTLYSPGLH